MGAWLRAGTPTLLWLALSAPPSASQPSVPVHCRVFVDPDASGVWEPGDAPLSGVRLTNGVQIFVTDAAGQASFSVDKSKYRFATLTIPSGYWPSTHWYHEVSAAGPDTVYFGLQPLAPSGEGFFRWAHISDTQVLTWGDPHRMDEDLEQINQLADRPLFAVNTGDLVEVGSDTTHWNNYVAQLEVSEVPVLPVVGNHDVLQTGSPLDYYER